MKWMIENQICVITLDQSPNNEIKCNDLINHIAVFTLQTFRLKSDMGNEEMTLFLYQNKI